MNSVIRDIAEKLLAGQEPSPVLQAYRDALESHDAPIVIVDSNGIIRFHNRSARAMANARPPEPPAGQKPEPPAGRKPEPPAGQPPADPAGQPPEPPANAKPPKDLAGKPVEAAGFPWHADGTALPERLAKGESTTYFEIDGHSYACEAQALFDKLNRGAGILEYIRTEGGWVRDEGANPLTGIAGKDRFLAETRRLLDCNPAEQYAIVYWGVIRFKNIVDVFSTATGKRVIQNIANSIASFAGEEGTCGHYGDDSFVFCVPRARLNADWFKRHSEVTLMSDTAMYTFKSTYGVFEIDDRTCSVETMCEHAAFAQSSLTSSFAAEDDCYAFYDSTMQKDTSEDQELVSQLSYALASNQVKVYYQPIYDISTGQVASAEALARWEHPEKGLIFPGRFIPLFESNGMITELDKHIWDQAAGFLEKRLAAGEKTVPVSINVSRVDFFATTLMDDFNDILESHALPRELLRIEITESAYTDDPKRIIDIIHTLRERGHTVLLDDFGSGYSSLTMLKDMPIDILKLDMSFLRDFDTDGRTKHIISHMVAMARDLGMRVVAEGVETQEQVNFLRAVDCHLAQGYFYARPLPEKDFVKTLDEAVPRGL